MENNDKNLRQQLVDSLQNKFSGVETSEDDGIVVSTKMLIDIMQELKENSDFGFDMLTNLTAIDHDEHFTIVYHLVSLKYGFTLTVKVRARKENPEVPSVVPIWGSADWQEREVYDLMGIVFTGHPNLKRILLDDHFEGHPLRKDYKVVGGRE